MRRAFAFVLVTALVAGSAAFAQDYRRDVPPPRDHVVREHVWARGERVPPQLRDRDHVVWDWRAAHLRRPPAGYVWIHDRDRFLLVAKNNGRIAELAEVR